MEQTANKVLAEYTNLYFGDAQSNAYFFETSDTGFGSAWLIKNDHSGMSGAESSTWDSMHTFTVEKTESGWSYTLVSTILLNIVFATDSYGKASIGGTSTRKSDKSVGDVGSDREHIERMGRMLEENEGFLRSQLGEIYVGKSKQIIASHSSKLVDRNKLTGPAM